VERTGRLWRGSKIDGFRREDSSLRRLSRALLLGLAVLLWALLGQAFASGLKLHVVEHRLRNGMRFFLMERRVSPTVACLIRFQVGSRLEAPGRTGISHLLEHMMFKGTRQVGTLDYEAEARLLKKLDELEARRRKLEASDGQALQALEKEIEEIRAKHARYVVKNELWHLYQRHGGVSLNAGTSRDGTTYVVELPANKIELWAFLESDRMADPVFREFYRERDVVLEERRLRIDSDPEGLLWERFMAAAYIAHPYRFPIIGWADDVRRFSRSEVEAYFSRFYSPANAFGVIVGDIDIDEVKKLLDGTFGAIPAREPPEVRLPSEPPQKGERRIVVRFEAEPRLIMGYHIPAVGHPDTYPLKVLAALLSRGRTSRFYKELIDRKRIAVEAEAEAGIWKDPGLFLIGAAPRAPHTIEELEEAIEAEIERLKSEGPTRWEIEKTRNQIDAAAVEHLRTNIGIAYQIVRAVAAVGDWRYIERERELLKAVRAEDVQRVARKYLTRENRTVALLLPPEKEGGDSQ
jgi:predicted Zn-dependent peptidase